MIKPFIDLSQDIRIGGVAGKLYQHINDNSVHLTSDEKKLLDKLSAEDSESEDITSSIDDIYVQLGNKADKDEIPTKVSQLENDMNFISEIPDYYTTEEEVKLLIQAYVEEGELEIDLDELKKQIEELTKLVNQYGLTIEDLRTIIDQNTLDIENIQNYIENELVQNVKNIVNEYITEEGIKFELEPATITRLGGIKVGSGLDITADGTLSVTGGGSGGGGGGGIDIDYLNEHYIRKDIDDETTNHITIGKGLNVTGDERVTGNIDTNGIIKSDTVQSHDMTRGMLGNGYYLGIDGHNGNNSILEIDDLLVRNKAYFEELELRKLSYVNGTIILSAAGGIIQSVEELENGNWKCYLKSDDGTTATTNTFQINDLVRCLTFDIKPGVYENVTNRFYWRQVVDLGTDENKNWIVLSKFLKSSDTQNDTSGIPAEGDTIVQYGNTLDESRQNIISISATDTNAPSITMYTHVYTFSLADATVSTVISPQEVKFRSDLFKLVSGNESYRIAIDRGEWEASTRYYYWDRVSYGGSLWLCIYQGADGCIGIEPGSETGASYWSLQVQKGDAGDPDSNPKIEFGEPIVTTAFDGSKYYPDLTNKSIVFHAETYDGLYIQDSNIISFSANSNNANLEISRDDENHAVIINRCELGVGETATISVHVALLTGTGEGSIISVTGKMTVICIEYPLTEHTLQAYVTPTSYKTEYQITYDDNGKIKNIQWTPEDINFLLYIYYGTKLITFSDLGTSSDNSGEHPYVRVSYFAEDTSHDLTIKQQPDNSATLYVRTSSDMMSDSSTAISEDVKSPNYSGSGYYPRTQYEINFDIIAGDITRYLTATFIVDINGSFSVFENTTKELLSVKTDIKIVGGNVTTLTSEISQTAGSITSLVSRVKTNEDSIDGIKRDYVTKTALELTAESITTTAEEYTNNQLTNYSTTEQTAEQITSTVKSYTDGQLMKYSTIEQTDSKIATVVTDYKNADEELRGEITASASSVNMTVVYAGLKEAGIDIAVDSTGGTPTGTVNIYGDLVTIKNKEAGQNVLWVEDDVAKIGNVEIVSGKIAGLEISGNSITNEGFNTSSSIHLVNIANGTRASIGDNVWPAGGYNTAVSRFENTISDYMSNINSNIAVYAEAKNSQAGNYAVLGTGNIVTREGSIASSTYQTCRLGNVGSMPHIDIRKGNVVQFISNVNTGNENKCLALPPRYEVEEFLKINTGDSFATLLYCFSGDSLYGTLLYGRAGNMGTEFPKLRYLTTADKDYITIHSGGTCIILLLGVSGGEYYAHVLNLISQS